MSIIASPYNTGTGLLTAVTNEGTLPIVVDDLTVNGNLTVIGTTTLKDEATAEGDLIVLQTTTTENLIVNNNSILNNGVGQNNTALFKLPLTNGTNNQVLTITDQTLVPITTAWQSPTVISNYVQYDTAQTKLKNNISGVISDINKIIINGSIGKTATEDFVLPTNTTAAVNGTTLAILDATATPKTTQWIVPVPTITDYVLYDTTTTKLKNNVSGVVSNIDKIIINGSIGKTSTQDFVLPYNTSTSGNGFKLTITDQTTTPMTTAWTSQYYANDFLRSNSETFRISTVIDQAETTVNSLTLDGTIGKIDEAFQLPNNTSTTSNGQILSILDATSKTTQWITPATPTLPDYVSYNTTTTQLSNNISGTPTVITNLRITNIGRVNNNFNLPSNTSGALPYSRLVLTDSVARTTTWYPSNGNVGYILATKVLTTEDSNGALPEISDIAVLKIGSSDAQLFSLPTNTSSAGANTVLKITNATTKETSWEPLTTTTQTSITTAIATASASTVEMCRASNLAPGTYIMTYQVEPEISTTTRAFTYRSYGVSTTSGSLSSNGVVGLNFGDSVSFTAPVVSGTTPLRYSGSGVVVLSNTTTLFLLVRFVYTGTTFNTKGTLRATRIA